MTIKPITYTQSTASLEVAPPYHFPDVDVHGFVWDASIDRIAAYCDRFLNGEPDDAERGFVYRPAAFWPYNLLLFIHYPKMFSSGRQKMKGQVSYSERGYITQTEVFVAMPVVRIPKTQKQLVSGAAFEWALPFIVVSDPMSAAAGREMIGLPKLLADIKTPETRYPDAYEAKVLVPWWLAAGKWQAQLEFLSVTTKPVLPTFWGRRPETSLWTLLQGRLGNLLMSGIGTALEAVDMATFGLMPTAMRVVSLRQYRDALRPDKAVYQALVTCRSKYTNISNFQFYNEQDVRIAFKNQESFKEILRYFLEEKKDSAGELTGKFQQVKPRAAFRFNADIDFDDMRTIHTFPTERGPGLAPIPRSSDLATSWGRSFRAFVGPRQPS
jgi:hypothetical protein